MYSFWDAPFSLSLLILKVCKLFRIWIMKPVGNKTESSVFETQKISKKM